VGIKIAYVRNVVLQQWQIVVNIFAFINMLIVDILFEDTLQTPVSEGPPRETREVFSLVLIRPNLGSHDSITPVKFKTKISKRFFVKLLAVALTCSVPKAAAHACKQVAMPNPDAQNGSHSSKRVSGSA
jgi:hypothetical protein